MRGSKLRSFSLVLLFMSVLLLGVASPSLSATQHAPNGVTDFMSGVLPPPGLYWLNYIGSVTKDKLRDNSGDKIKGADLDVKAYFDAFRFVYMTPIQLFGANYGVQAVLPIYDAKFAVNTPGGRLKSDSSGLGDIMIDPIVLAWHFSPNFHMAAGIDILLPTGNYDEDEIASTIFSKNLITFEPVLVASYWVPGGIDLSTKLNLDFHTSNSKPFGGGGKLQPGAEFHCDWAVSYALTQDDEWRAGLVGLFYQQLEKDKLDGSTAGQELTRTAAAGVAVKYWPKMGPINFTLKYTSDFAGKNTPEGQNLWLNFIWSL